MLVSRESVGVVGDVSLPNLREANIFDRVKGDLRQAGVLSDSGFTGENPKHDFPKKIEYQWNEDSLWVTISDDERSVEFNFKKGF